MNDEDARIDIAEAIGKASAAVCLQSALVETLRRKGILSDEEIATLTGLASISLRNMELSEDAAELAEASLRGVAKTYAKPLSKQ
jgi:hypothetical protein